MDNGQQDWGHFTPRGLGAWLLGVVRCGLSHGKIRHELKQVWLSSDLSPVVDAVRGGIKWRLDISDNVTDGRILLGSTMHDKREISALIAAAQRHTPAGVFIDIGANIGYYSLHLAKAGATVLALEPNPIAHQRLLYNIHLNDLAHRITALPLGIGESGEQTLAFYRNYLGGGSIINPHQSTDSKHIRIETLPLADILRAHNITKISAMKVDIEGAEDRALMPFFAEATEQQHPDCLVIKHLHQHIWETDIIQHCIKFGYARTHRTKSNTVLTKS